MKSAEGKPFIYEKNQLIEVICQLRFPTILSIKAKEPAEFQDTIRENFPVYRCQTEKLAAAPNSEPKTVQNHSFIAENGGYRLSLTKNFIALSSMRYTSWEDFAHTLDEPLGQFIRIYRPAYFERVGLRYVNGVSRERLGLQERRWNDLFQPQYLSVLDSDSVDERSVNKCATDIEMKLDEHASIKLHAGPGLVRCNVRTGNGMQVVQEKESRFIFDQDLFSTGNIKLPAVMEMLDLLHGHADRIFSEAITDVLHDAMDAVEI
ncbi:MAG: TIGR04255 family protein [Oscillospiraceae bacterium]|nr:TIGR04255 family protein [Oscillospiraceae bacterium]